MGRPPSRSTCADPRIRHSDGHPPGEVRWSNEHGDRRTWGPAGCLQAGRCSQQGGGARSHQAGEPRGPRRGVCSVAPSGAAAATAGGPGSNVPPSLSVFAAARPSHCSVRPAAAGGGGPRSAGAHAGGVQVRRRRHARRRLACGWTQPGVDGWRDSHVQAVSSAPLLARQAGATLPAPRLPHACRALLYAATDLLRPGRSFGDTPTAILGQHYLSKRQLGEGGGQGGCVRQAQAALRHCAVLTSLAAGDQAAAC